MSKEVAKHSELTLICLAPAQDKVQSQDQPYASKHIRISVDKKKRVAEQWWSFIQQGKKHIKKLLNANEFSTFIASDLYSLALGDFAVKKSPKRKDIRLIYDSREIYSALGSLSDRPLAQWITSRIEQRYLRNVTTVLASGQADIDYIKPLFPRGIDYKLLMNLPPKVEIRKPINLHQRFDIPSPKNIAIYQGAISKGRGLDICIEAFKKIPDWHLIILGEGPYLAKLLARNIETPNVHLPGAVPYTDLLNYTAGADLGLSLIEPISESYKQALPNKLFEYFMAGIPAIVSDLPAMRAVIEKSGGGVLVPHDTTPEYLSSLIASSQLTGRLEKLAQEAKAAAEKYCYESQAEMISTLIR